MHIRQIRLILKISVLLIVIMTNSRSAPASAAGPWYVAPGGSDSNDCDSIGAPCETINGAIGKATAGDTIYVAEGTYTSLGSEVVNLNKDISLSGGWDISFSTQSSNSTIDGEDTRRGITLNTSITAVIE